MSNEWEGVIVEKVVPRVWPDAALEKEMIASATELTGDADYFSDVQCHVCVLLERIRDLEAVLAKREGYRLEQ